MGWLCGYQGPLQDIVSVFDGLVGLGVEGMLGICVGEMWENLFLLRWKPVVFNQTLELSFLKQFDSECQGLYRFI